MKLLESIRVVQFFLYEKQEIQLAEITGMFGPNGSGKSSMLDAVQIAMMGGNSRYVALNAQADAKASTRTLRAYCLGQYGDLPEQRARDNATTYITLIWRDSVKKEPLSMGVCLRASVDRDGHEVLGRYIARGLELSMGDHLETVNGEERPREWSTFRHQLCERAKKITGDDPLYPDSDRFIRSVLLALRGSGRSLPPSPEAFIKAFRFALRMKFDKSVDQIVRDDVLEARPTNINKFKEVTESFRQLKLLIDHLVAKIGKGERALVEYDRAVVESRHVATWSLLSKKAFAELASEKLDRAGAAAEEVVQQLKVLEGAEADLDRKLNSARQAELQARAQREAHASHKDYGALQTEIQHACEQVEQQRKSLSNTVLYVQRTLQSIVDFEPMVARQDELSAACAALDPLRAAILAGSASRDEVCVTMAQSARAADAAYNDLLKQQNAVRNALERALENEKIALEDLGRVKSGKAPLSEDAKRLLLDLRDAAVQATPVCDLVRVKDPEWQPVIEGYLRSNVEALLVANGDESDAFRVYREHRTVYGVKIVMESREATGRTPKPGTVAALIEGDHPSAVAFLQRQFGDMVCANSNAEAMGSQSNHRSLTKDGMLVSGAQFERIRPMSLSNLKIGVNSGAQRETIEHALAAAKSEVRRLGVDLQKIEQLQKNLRGVAAEDAVVKRAESEWDAMSVAEATVLTKTRQMSAAADEDYRKLSEEENRWKEQVALLAKDREQLLGDKVRAEEARKQVERALHEAKQAHQAAVEAVELDRTNPDVDPDFEAKQWDMLLEKHDSNCEAMRHHADAQRVASQRKMEAAINSGSRELGGFLIEYNEHIPADVTGAWAKERSWLGDLLKTLKDTELAPNQERMAEAHRTSEETFRNDVAIALNGHFEDLESTMDRLNKVLRECPVFSNGERYRFRRKVRPQLESLMRFTKNVAAHGPAGDLLGGPGEMPPEFQALLEDKVAAGNVGAKSPLDDYREFFEFDIEILREDVETSVPKVVGLLSKRLGPGSGGEHRSPLYVIAGAALASAYRLENGNRDGIRLILLDEAFSTMDQTNSAATMRYLQELGLQVFLASPGENLGNLTGFLHRYYDIVRDVDNNAILIERQDVSEEARTLFLDDLPEFNPELVAQEIVAMQTESGAAAAAR